MTALRPIFNQVVYPGSGGVRDVDDCWVVATIHACLSVHPTAFKPTITQFRADAGDPDDGVRDGGNLDEVMRGATGTWPNLTIRRMAFWSWDVFEVAMRKGGTASIAVHSGYLPTRLQYGFKGMHQVSVGFEGGWRIANPLAPQGSAPQAITEAELRSAIDHYANAGVLGAFFPEEDELIRTRVTTYRNGYRHAHSDGRVTGFLEDGHTLSVASWSGLVAGTAIVTRDDDRAPKGSGWVVGASRPFTNYLIPATDLVISDGPPVYTEDQLAQAKKDAIAADRAKARITYE